LPKSSTVLSWSDERIDKSVLAFFTGRTPVLVQNSQPELEAPWVRRAPQILSVAPVNELSVVIERRWIGDAKELFRDQRPKFPHTRIIVVKTRAAVRRYLLRPKIETAFIRVIGKKVAVLLPDKESLIVNRIRRGRKRPAPKQTIRCACWDVTKLAEARITVHKPDDT